MEKLAETREEACCVCFEVYSDTCIPLCLTTGILVCASCAFKLQPRVCPMTRKPFSEIPRPCNALLTRMSIDAVKAREQFEALEQSLREDGSERERQVEIEAFAQMFTSSMRQVRTEDVESTSRSLLHRATRSMLSNRQSLQLGEEIVRISEQFLRSIDVKPMIWYVCTSVALWVAIFRNASRPERHADFQRTFEYMAFQEIINPTESRNGALFRVGLFTMLLCSASRVGGLEIVNTFVAGGCSFELQVIASLIYICAGIANMFAGLSDGHTEGESVSPRDIAASAWSGVQQMAFFGSFGSILCFLLADDYPFFFTSVIIPVRLTFLGLSSILGPIVSRIT